MAEPIDFFPQAGEMAALIRAKDWTQTPLGSPATWSPSLRTLLRLMLSSRFAMWMGWGPDLAFFYNDAYARQTLGAKHPRALGRPAREVWAEVWAELDVRVKHVLQSGEATWDESLLLFLERSGYPEETYHTFSYSPAPGDAPGEVGGLFCVVVEETERVIGERRIALLQEFAALVAQTNSEEEVFGAVERSLAANARDIPFALTYLFEEDGSARRVSQTGFAEAHASAPERIAVDRGAPWPFLEVLSTGSPVIVPLAADQRWPTGDWEKAPSHAIAVPIAYQGHARPAGVFVAGVNPHRPLDRSLQSFVELFAGQFAAALSNARAYHEERRRADALAEIDRTKTAFFSNVSHEFRTPLTLMLGPTEDALGSPERALRGADLEMVHRNELRLLKLVNALLDFARIEAGRIQASYEPTDLSVLTADLASSFRSAIERAGLVLDVDCPPLSEALYVDRDMWEKIVLNLLSNALKFTFEGRIAVGLRPRGDFVDLTVRDTGVGVAPGELPRLFERFHRIEGTRARTHEGSGIGLALVHDLVRLHGGTIEVTSQIGEGTTFTVAIPRGKAHLPAERISAPRPVASSTTATAYIEEALRWTGSADPSEPAQVESPDSGAPDLRTRIVVADDNADMREYIVRLLRERWAVEAVSDGLAALEAVRRSEPALVLTDVMMPGLDGFGLLRAMRADARLRTIPVILLSARAGEEASAEGLRTGADDYIVKPFTARDLVVRVASRLAAAKATLDVQRARDQAEELAARLSSTSQRLRAAQQVAGIGIFDWDLKTDAVFWSPELYALMGLTPGAIEPRPESWTEQLYDEGDRETGWGAYRDAIAARKPTFEIEVRLRQADGRSRWVRLSTEIQYDEAGTPSRLLGAVVDIELLKEAAATRARALAEAERTGRAKDEFLATMSHELRTPLNAILGWARILRTSRVDEKKVEHGMTVIQRNAETQARLVSDLLDVSRIVSGKLRLTVQKVSVATVVHAAVDVVRQAADAKGVRLVLDLDPDLGSILGDPDRLQQIVWNLLANAVKFTPASGSVTVAAFRADSMVSIRVEDTGAGVSSEDLPFIFERFRQVDSSTTRAHGGLGLGLAIVRHLAEAHGGTVAAVSDGIGRGATFTVSLPLRAVFIEAEVAKEDGAPSEPSSAAMASSANRLNGAGLLVVDDDEDSLDLLRVVLEGAGASVNTASSARVALEKSATRRFDLVVSDIGMPEMDGYAFMRSLRQRHPDVPAIALTAYARAEDAERAHQAGYQHHIAKPVDADELVAIIERLLG
jgi:PAS domain S-box-containing protein